ncbi:hypothetical protein GOBAR_DD06587 [Gossypium barbadense]|nr:hypothetical protein GOBAR_DD06587 [Gossypium barbadense]
MKHVKSFHSKLFPNLVLFVFLVGYGCPGLSFTGSAITLTLLLQQAQESEILTIDGKPGWKKGTKITFLDKGNEQPNQLSADLLKPHPINAVVCELNWLLQ